MKNTITISNSKQIRFVPADDILKMEAVKNYTVFYEKNGNQHVMRKCIGDVMKKLGANDHLKNVFFRVNKSTAVNLKEVRLYRQGRGGTVVLSNEAAITVAYRRRSELLRTLAKLRGE